MSTAALEAEVQRLQCLQALGITVYHPRFRLPGAKPSVLGPWPDLEVEEQPSRVAVQLDTPRPDAGGQQPREAVSGATVTRPVARLDLDKEIPAPAAKAAQPAATAPRRAEGPAVAVQNFQLLFLQVDAELAVLNQIPALARPQLHDKPLALLTNVLRWLGKSVPAQAPRVFRWPLPGLENMAATMNPETSLLHFLEQACTERPFRYVLHLGPQAVAAPSAAWQSFATHSLDEMIALPALKREAWQALLPLHALLHESA